VELRKQTEKDLYNKRAEEIIKKKNYLIVGQYGSKRYGPIVSIPIRFAEEKIKEIINNKREEITLLDYGCGMGIHSIFPAKLGAKVYGIDISEKSLEIAKERARQEGVERQATFLVMDCEKLEFPANFFDIIFNCGTLSCVDRKKAYPEIVRVLKPDGYFISIDALGHNPLLSLSRKIKVIRGLRTQQGVANILKMEDVVMARQYFRKTEVSFFDIATLVAIPFQKLPGFNLIAKFLERIDKVLLKSPFFQKYAFKVVFIFSFPQQGDKVR
jgi:ubiquinone/menaquinone biosynthesis C-methylase UbiE